MAETLTAFAVSTGDGEGHTRVRVEVEVRPGWKIFGDEATVGLPTVFTVPPGWTVESVVAPTGEIRDRACFDGLVAGPEPLREITMRYQPCSGEVCHRPVLVTLGVQAG